MRRFCVFTLVLALSTSIANAQRNDVQSFKIGLLWDREAIPEVIHLERSMRAMINISTSGEDSQPIDIVLVEVTKSSPFKIYQEVCSAIQQGASAFVTALSCPQLLPTLTALGDLRVPILVVDNHCENPASFPVNSLFFPTARVDMSAVINDVMKDIQWKNIALVYDAHHVKQFDEISNILAYSNATVQGLRLKSGSPALAVRDTIDFISNGFSFNNSPEQFLVICTFECIAEFFIQANLFDKTRDAQGWFGFRTSWLFLAEDPSWLPRLERHVEDLDNVAAIVRMFPDGKSLESLVEEVFSHVLHSLRDVQAQLNLSPGDATELHRRNCDVDQHLAVLLTSDIQMSLNESSCLNCTIYGVYTAFRKSSGRRFEVVLEKSPAETIRHGHVFPNTNFDLNARHFLIATNTWSPFVIESENVTSFQGLCIELLQHLSLTLNFTYDLVLPPDGAWGAFSNGTFNGLVGMLANKEADMTMAPLSITIAREHVMDFSEPFYLEYNTVLLKLPDPDDAKWALYLSPFKWQVWLSIVASVIVSGIILWLMTKFSPYYEKECLTNGLAKLDNAIIYTLGSLFTQGGIYLPEAQSGRFFVGFWWMYCIVMVATYSGNLIAFLTVTKPSMPFNSLEEMVNQTDYIYGTLGDAYLQDYFEEATSGVYAKIGSTLLSNLPEYPYVLSGSHSEHMQKVFEGKYAYINDKTSFEIAMSTVCDVEMFKEEFLATQYAMGLQNNSAFRDVISNGIRIIKEGGLINRWKQQWWPRQSFCSRGMVTVAKAVTLKDVQGIYYALGFLIFCASAALIVETLLKRQFNKSAEKSDAAGKEDGHGTSNGVLPVQIGSVLSSRPPAGYEYAHLRPPAGHGYDRGNQTTSTSSRPPSGWEQTTARAPAGWEYSTRTHSGWEYSSDNKGTPAYDYATKDTFAHNYQTNFNNQFIKMTYDY